VAQLGQGAGVEAPLLGVALSPGLLLELAPELPGGVTAHVPTGLEQRRRTRQGTALHAHLRQDQMARKTGHLIGLN